MDAHLQKRQASKRLTICLGLSLCAILLPALIAYLDLEMYATYATPISLFSLALSIAILMISLGTPANFEGIRAGLLSILVIISVCGNITFPLFVTSQFNHDIAKYLNDTDLYNRMAAWPVNQQMTDSLDLAALSPRRSAAIVQKYGDVLIYSELNSSCTHSILAHGRKNLRYVVVLEEIQAGETLSAKWEAYYQRGWEVGQPAPVRYLQIDWMITLVDLELEQVLARTTLTAEPPDDYYRPLSSRVEIRPKRDLFFDWLGY